MNKQLRVYHDLRVTLLSCTDYLPRLLSCGWARATKKSRSLSAAQSKLGMTVAGDVHFDNNDFVVPAFSARN